MSKCRICENQNDNKTYVAREMQFGYRDEFEYFECAKCGCLQIKEIPTDLPKYYPHGYYSYKPAKSLIEYKKKGIKGLKERFVRDQITKYYLNRKSAIGGWLEKKSCLSESYPLWLKIQRLNLKLNKDSSILDVGCGTGQSLLDLKAQGFSNLMGIDPFIERDVVYDNGVKVVKCRLDSLSRQFDFIMLHHSFEHMPDPLPTLQKLHELLKSDRYVLLRIPVAGSYGWKKYGVNWFALDAPRHLFLHTLKSMEILAGQSGFEVADVVFDGIGYTLWASEQYLRDIPMVDERSYEVNPAKSIFTEQQIEEFRALDAELNKSGEADTACFYLYKNR